MTEIKNTEGEVPSGDLGVAISVREQQPNKKEKAKVTFADRIKVLREICDLLHSLSRIWDWIPLEKRQTVIECLLLGWKLLKICLGISDDEIKV